MHQATTGTCCTFRLATALRERSAPWSALRPLPHNTMRPTRPRSVLLQLLCIAAAVSAAAAQGGVSNNQPPPDGGPFVVDLNQFTIYGSIADGRLWFVEYYVPWCRGCKRMAGQWADLAVAFAPVRDIVIARFDCMLDEPLCERMGIEHTPTTKLYLDGQEVQTYKADFYHVDLMRPFLERMYKKYMVDSGRAARYVGQQAATAEGGVSVTTPRAAAGPAAALSMEAQPGMTDKPASNADAAAGAAAQRASNAAADEPPQQTVQHAAAPPGRRQGRHGGPAVEQLMSEREEL